MSKIIKEYELNFEKLRESDRVYYLLVKILQNKAKLLDVWLSGKSVFVKFEEEEK